MIKPFDTLQIFIEHHDFVDLRNGCVFVTRYYQNDVDVDVSKIRILSGGSGREIFNGSLAQLVALIDEAKNVGTDRSGK